MFVWLEFWLRALVLPGKPREDVDDRNEEGAAAKQARQLQRAHKVPRP